MSKLILKTESFAEDLERIRDLHCPRPILFTNGCFDLLHIGHIRLLRQAKYAYALCPVVVVGVNDDKSVTELKGPDRPFVPLMERMEMLAALTYVDYVVPFSNGNIGLLELIEKLKPDILLKGDDWAFDEIVGGELVLKNGGKVVRYHRSEDHSTSKLVVRIRGGK